MMRDWAGWALSMAALALAVAAGGQPPAAPAPAESDRAALPGKAASQAPAGISWGPGRDIQAGVALTNRYGRPDQHTGLYIFSVYLRNRTDRKLTVDCPSFPGLSVPADDTSYTPELQSPSIFCTPRLLDSKGRRVTVGFKVGPEHDRFDLGPGQIALVSHWMLRTMARRAKGSGTAKYTQVAFVEPGKYRLHCDVSASCGGKDGRRTALRTGDLAFDVTAEDLAR